MHSCLFAICHDLETDDAILLLSGVVIALISQNKSSVLEASLSHSPYSIETH